MVLQRVLDLLKLDFDVVGTVSNGKDLVSEAQQLRPDVVLTDIAMPILTGIDAAQELRRVGLPARLVFFTVHQDAELVQACFAAGALGYVHKSRLNTDLIPAIAEALAGRRFISAATNAATAPA